MKTVDFDRWWKDLTLRFPSVSEWLVRVHPSNDQQRQLLRAWCAVLEDTELADALEVNRLMLSGDLELPRGGGDLPGGYGSEQQMPQHVRRLARQIAWDREGGHERGELPPLGPKGSGFPARQIINRWHKLMRDGMTREEARAKALEEFPVGVSVHREPRYSCLLCRDTGRVLVASNDAIEAVILGTFDRCHHRDAVMRCSCQIGQRLVRKFQGRDIPWVTFNEAADFAIKDTLWREPEQRRFAAWVEGQRDKRAEALAQASANYEPAFAAFNRGSE